MRARRFAVLWLAFLAITPSTAQLPHDWQRKFDDAERRIVRLQPSAFPELPRNIIRELQLRKCTVPQPWPAKKRSNVIKGEFARPGQTDWAVLCSVKGISRILVFWNGSTERPAEIAARKDANYLQTVTADEIGYSRGIDPVGKQYIMQHYKAYGGPTPPPINHQGIDDAFIEKASEVRYFYKGKWLSLTGSD